MKRIFSHFKHAASMGMFVSFVFLWFSVLSGIPLIVAADKAPKKEDGVSLRTVNLVEPIGGFRRIQIEGKLGGKGFLDVDRGSGEFDMFGEPGARAAVAFEPIEIELRPVKLAKEDPAKRRLFDIVSDGKLKVRLRLLISATADGPHRLLVLDEKGKVTRAVTLEPYR